MEKLLEKAQELGLIQRFEKYPEQLTKLANLFWQLEDRGDQIEEFKKGDQVRCLESGSDNCQVRARVADKLYRIVWWNRDERKSEWVEESEITKVDDE